MKNRGAENAGHLAFLLLLSMFPFLFFFTAIAGYFGSIVDESSYNITKKLASVFTENVPENIIQGIMPYIEEILQGPNQGILTFAILGAVWTASSVVVGIKSVINTAYGFEYGCGFFDYIFDRIISLLEFLTISLVIFLFFTAPRIIPLIKKYIANISLLDLHSSFIPWHLFPLLYLFCFIVAIYMFLPQKRQKFFYVAPGAMLVVILWIVTSKLFSFYIKSFAQVGLIYGSIAGVIVVLLFFYISNLCFIYGAEFNNAFKTHFEK